jgi:hypothetical protein
MANNKEQQLQAFARRAARVSKALWPTNVSRSIATGRASQTRRRLIVKSRWWRWLMSFKQAARPAQTKADGKSFLGFPGKSRAPETPMPVEPPLVRVLETLDLSQTNIEHFLDLPESGNTGGYSLKWKEERARMT